MAAKSAHPATSDPVGYETQFWQMAHALCSSMDAAEFKRAVLDLISPNCFKASWSVMWTVGSRYAKPR